MDPVKVKHKPSFYEISPILLAVLSLGYFHSFFARNRIQFRNILVKTLVEAKLRVVYQLRETRLVLWHYLPSYYGACRCWSHYDIFWIKGKGLIMDWKDVIRNQSYFGLTEIQTLATHRLAIQFKESKRKRFHNEWTMYAWNKLIWVKIPPQNVLTLPQLFWITRAICGCKFFAWSSSLIVEQFSSATTRMSEKRKPYRVYPE